MTADEHPAPHPDHEPAPGPGLGEGRSAWARARWTGGGVLLMVSAAVLLYVAQTRPPEVSDDMRFYLTVVLRGAVFLLLSAGAYCVVRGRRRG